MDVKPIRNEKDLRDALVRIDQIIDAEFGTPEYDELEVLSTLVEVFEEKQYTVPPPDPIEAIKFRMDQLGLKQADVAKYFGGKNRASEVLSHKRSLNLRMIRTLHENLQIPAESLIKGQVGTNSNKPNSSVEH